MSKSNVTRGYGLLEGFLAKQRSRIVDRLIPSAHREGCILDIGCGTYPFFLMNTEFSEKYGLDKVAQENYGKRSQDQKITLINYDIEREDIIPFDSGYFSVVTMIAVFEHIDPERLVVILREIYRVLGPDGMYIITTPTVWADGLLRVMARLRLVSPAEIEEHKDYYSPLRISSMLQKADFGRETLRFGYFEMFMNTWIAAKK